MRLPRLFAAGEVQLVEVRFTPALTRAWQTDAGHLLLDRLVVWLSDQVRTNALSLHAWALSPARLLLLTTAQEAGAVPGCVQAIGRRLGAALQAGSVFAGRYKSALIHAQWVLTTQVWVEHGPVFDGLANDPVSWPWSSAHAHVGLKDASTHSSMPLVTHAAYWASGNTPFERQAAHKKRLEAAVTDGQRRQIESALQGQWALGPDSYLESLGKVASRRVRPRPRGRPRKAQPSSA
jgi:putative transposase